MATRTSILGGAVSGLRDLLTPKKDKKEEDTTTRQVTPTATIGGVSAKEVISGTKKEEVKVPTTITPSSNRATISGVSAKEVISGTKKPTIGIGTPVSELSIKPSDVTRSIRPPITISGTDRLQLSDKTPAYGTRQIDITLPKEAVDAQKSLRDTVLSDAISRQEKDIVNSQKILDDKRNEIEDTTKKIKELESQNVKNGQWVGEDDKVFEEYQQLYSDYSRLNSEYDRELNRYVKDAESYKVNVQKLDLSLRQKAFEESGIGSSFYYTVNRLTLDPKFDPQALIPKTKERKTGPRFGDIAMSSPLTLGVSLATKREVHPESLLFGFIDTKPFYLPTEKDRKAFEKEARGGVFGDIAEFQRKTMDQYNKDMEEYRRLNLDYAMTGQYNPKIAEIAKNLSNVKTGSQWRKTAEDKYVKYGRFPGYFQRYGTEMAGQLLAGEALGLGIQAATKTAVGERIGRTAVMERVIKPAITSAGKSRLSLVSTPATMGVIRGGAEYWRTRDLERAIAAGTSQALFVGVPFSIRNAKMVEFRRAYDKLSKKPLQVLAETPTQFADGSYLAQSRGVREYGDLMNIVDTRLFVNPDGTQITRGEVITRVINKNTGAAVTHQSFLIPEADILKLSSRLYEMKAPIVDVFSNKNFLVASQTIIQNKVDKTLFIFGDNLKRYIDGSMENQKLLGGVSKEGVSTDFTFEQKFPGVKGFGMGSSAGQVNPLDALPDDFTNIAFGIKHEGYIPGTQKTAVVTTPKGTVAFTSGDYLRGYGFGFREPYIMDVTPGVKDVIWSPFKIGTTVPTTRALPVPTPVTVPTSSISSATSAMVSHLIPTPTSLPLMAGEIALTTLPSIAGTSALTSRPSISPLGFTGATVPAISPSSLTTSSRALAMSRYELVPRNLSMVTKASKKSLTKREEKYEVAETGKEVIVKRPTPPVAKGQFDLMTQDILNLQQKAKPSQHPNLAFGIDVPFPPMPWSPFFVPFGFPAIPGFQWVWDKKTGKWVKRPIKKGVTKKVKTTDTRPTLFQSQLLGEKKSERGDKGPLSGFEWIR